MGEKNIKFLS